MLKVKVIHNGVEKEMTLRPKEKGNIKMALVIKDTSVVPPERWHYPGVNGYTVDAPNYAALFSAIEAHYRANNQPVPSNQEVIDFLCATTHVPCYEQETRVPLINKFSQNLPVPATSCCGGKK